MEISALVWLGFLVLFLVAEIITTGLTSVFLAAGSLVALLLNVFGLNMAWQIIGFLVGSFVLLYFTRPFAIKYINANREKTNYEGLIGQVVRVTERVDNRAQTGHAVLNGMDWMARAQDEDEILEPDSMAVIVQISGVKLMLERMKEEE